MKFFRSFITVLFVITLFCISADSVLRPLLTLMQKLLLPLFIQAEMRSTRGLTFLFLK